MKYSISLLVGWLGAVILPAQTTSPSALNQQEFHRYWQIESESPHYELSFLGDTVEVVSPKGLTLWRKEPMRGTVTIEYDACIMDQGLPGDRLSDLNAFWMASDPKHPTDLWKRMEWRSGIFVNCYSLQLYYLGYGGNHNATTRFRRYDGNEAAITEPQARPAILREYSDEAHLLQPNKWYRIKITNEGNRVQYYIDGERIVDYRDPHPLTEGWFGFRTTLSRARITNFRYTASETTCQVVPLHWVGDVPAHAAPVSFGVPFKQGELPHVTALSLLTTDKNVISADKWPLAYWPDGSIKWAGMAAVIPPDAGELTLQKSTNHRPASPLIETEEYQQQATPLTKKQSAKSLKKAISAKQGAWVTQTDSTLIIKTGVITAVVPRQGGAILQHLSHGETQVGGAAYLVGSKQSALATDGSNTIVQHHFRSHLKQVTLESIGHVRAVVKLEGVHMEENSSKEWLPFVLRLYFYKGSEEVKMAHTFLYDGDSSTDFISSLGISFEVPLREELYNRHVAFATSDGGVWSEPIQPLVGRRVLQLPAPASCSEPSSSSVQPTLLSLQEQQMRGMRIPQREAFDVYNRGLIEQWASWGDFRLSQLASDGYTLRKRTKQNHPWIGTFGGARADGYAFLGDVSGGLGLFLSDFWQAYPSTLEVTQACTDRALLTVWLWSPEGEPMDLRHYDDVAHGLDASYEDVQEGLNTPYGIARTHTLTLLPQAAYPGKERIAQQAKQLVDGSRLLPTPHYLHACRAFGVWSLPDRTTPFRAKIEDRLEGYMAFYQQAIEQHKWYGFWNYGDVMHGYDPVRHSWKYDVGGYAWDNTELASNMWLWYNFLRTGSKESWQLAAAMSRHTGEVDVYHLGPNEGLGTRHNVTHWGCGAKEARISQAAWNRFYYYLTTDERTGDLMREVKDAEQKLYTLDPMRLAQPRSEHPCTAPARLRIGPDWLAYAGNWMTEWERTGNDYYRQKIVAGMQSIASLPNGLFTGPKALGFDPATGIISHEGAADLQNTNHLMTIMGGFEVMNELLEMVPLPAWEKVWLDHARHYKEKALRISRNRFVVARLLGYAAYQTSNLALAQEAWSDLLKNSNERPFWERLAPPVVPTPLDEWKTISTNEAATWSLDAIYLQEVAPID